MHSSSFRRCLVNCSICEHTAVLLACYTTPLAAWSLGLLVMSEARTVRIWRVMFGETASYAPQVVGDKVGQFIVKLLQQFCQRVQEEHRVVIAVQQPLVLKAQYLASHIFAQSNPSECEHFRSTLSLPAPHCVDKFLQCLQRTYIVGASILKERQE